jgi:hypothetical protein
LGNLLTEGRLSEAANFANREHSQSMTLIPAMPDRAPRQEPTGLAFSLQRKLTPSPQKEFC